jgi:glycine/D-amino acid oxidase-like deaminating enzyme
MSSSPDGIYDVGIIDPGNPVETPTQPFWLSQPAKHSKLRSRWTETADVVVIGSGMAAVSFCMTLISRRPGLKIVIVEAGDLCSGATGRNGGYCKAMSPGVWFDRKQQYGVREAIQVMDFEHSHLDEMFDMVKRHGIDCGLRLVESLDVYHDKVTFGRAVRALEDMRKHAPQLASKYTVYTSRAELRARNCADHVIGAIGIPAATIWPYKFVTALWDEMVSENGLAIQTNTVVTSVVDEDDGPEGCAVVRTARGPIRTPQVVHATNAWMSHLVPELQPFVSPVRAIVQRQVPVSSSLRVATSFWFRYAEKEYDYLIQRPDGAFIVGRANTGRRATSDDGTKDLGPHVHLRHALPHIFDFGTDTLQVTHAWSGCVAFTQDGNPFVGRLPFAKKRRQWVCGAYQGIGMVRAFRSAQMLALLVLGEELPVEYPKSMLVTADPIDSMTRSLGTPLPSSL